MSRFTDLANPWVAGLGVYESGRPIEEVARELGFENPGEITKLASDERLIQALSKVLGRA